MNVPNALSILRILMIPFFAVLYLTAKTPQDYWFAAGLLLLSGLTDVLDGIIARKYHLVTKLGRILDPVADKLTQAAVCVLLAIRNPDLSILPIMYIIKEGLMLIGGYKILKKSKDIASSRWFGKMATVVFYGTMMLLIAFPNLPTWFTFSAITVVIVCMIFSFTMYLPLFFKYYQDRDLMEKMETEEKQNKEKKTDDQSKD